MDDIENLKNTRRIEYFHLPLVGLITSMFGILAIITTKDPGSGGPIIIMIFLLLSFIFSLSILGLLLQYLVRIFHAPPFSWGRLLYTSVALAAGVVFLIGLQTLHQLQLIDAILVFVFELVLTFYLLRRF